MYIPSAGLAPQGSFSPWDGSKGDGKGSHSWRRDGDTRHKPPTGAMRMSVPPPVKQSLPTSELDSPLVLTDSHRFHWTSPSSSPLKVSLHCSRAQRVRNRQLPSLLSLMLDQMHMAMTSSVPHIHFASNFLSR